MVTYEFELVNLDLNYHIQTFQFLCWFLVSTKILIPQIQKHRCKFCDEFSEQ